VLVVQGVFILTVIRRIQLGIKAARKREWPPRPDPNVETEVSDQSVGSSPSESSDDNQQLDRPESDTEKPGTEESDHDVVEFVKMSRRSFSPPEIEFLEPPKKTIKKLEPTPPLIPQPTQAFVEPTDEPSENLITAVEVLTLSSLRMQKVKQLPFLLRNLRTGFISRCRSLNIPTQRILEEIFVTVRYEHYSAAGEYSFETQMEHWVCPLCELHGAFLTREMLASHLSWDHDEVRSQWNEIDQIPVSTFLSPRSNSDFGAIYRRSGFSGW
jgi:hypothetical protein